MNKAEYVEQLYRIIKKEKLGDAIADKLEIAEIQRDFLIDAILSAVADFEDAPAKAPSIIAELESVIELLPFDVVQTVTGG